MPGQGGSVARLATLTLLHLVQPPLFPSDCEFAQLLTIFQIMGTPSEDTWPGVTQLKDWCAPAGVVPRRRPAGMLSRRSVRAQCVQARLSPVGGGGHACVHVECAG